MITTTQMYWLVILDNIIRGAVVVLVVTAVASIFTCIGAWCDEIPKWIAKTTVGALVASILLLTFTPSTKQMAAIIIVPRIVNNEKVQVVGNGLYDLAVEWMDELRPKKPKKEGK